MVKICKTARVCSDLAKLPGQWGSISISETRRDWIPPLRVCTPLATSAHMRVVWCAHSPAWVGAESKKSRVEKSKNHQKIKDPKKNSKNSFFWIRRFLVPKPFLIDSHIQKYRRKNNATFLTTLVDICQYSRRDYDVICANSPVITS